METVLVVGVVVVAQTALLVAWTALRIVGGKRAELPVKDVKRLAGAIVRKRR